MSLEPTYFAKRMNQLGLWTVACLEGGKVIKERVINRKNQIWVNNPDAEHPMPSRYKADIFSKDTDGNINILYWRLSLDLISYAQIGNGKMSEVNGKIRHYVSKRLSSPQDGYKYKNPKGQGAPPWIPKDICDKHAAGTKIETLFLTEGAFKAFYASTFGLDIIGFSSISTYRDKESKGLHSDIIKVIEDCEVQNVVVLWDGDCRDISEKALAMRTDLAARPTSFYGYAKAIKTLVQKIKFKKTREHPNVIFMHCKGDTLPGKPKGLDDMLIAAESDKQRFSIIKDAQRVDSKSLFFYKRNITRSTATLYKYFHLDNYESFYNLHQETIESTEFLFRGDLVRWDDTQEKLIMMAPAYAKEIRWIGDEFFKDIIVPGAKNSRRVLSKRSKQTLTDLHGKNFLDFLEYYEQFCNVPSHLDYQQVLEQFGKKYYNRYFPFIHKAKKGNCDTILNFYQHIFGTEKVVHGETGKEIESWEMGLDYTQSLLLRPNQNLPILILYSPENATGKSTFGVFHQKLFTDNVMQISNADLQSDFNEPYADKLLAICEETLLDRKKDAERIKSISTADQVLVNPKGQRQFSIDFFCKFMFFSNNKRMIYANRHDERYWVMQVYPAKKRDPNLQEKMVKEIPAFIEFLQNRKMATQQESRMWFHPSMTRTTLFDEVVQVNEPGGASDIRDGISDMFLQEPNTAEIEMTLGDITKEFLPTSSTAKWVREILKDYLQVDLERNQAGQSVNRRGIYVKYERGIDSIERREIHTRGRHYIFKREDFITDDEVDSSSFDIDTKMNENIEQMKMQFNPAEKAGEQVPFV